MNLKNTLRLGAFIAAFAFIVAPISAYAQASLAVVDVQNLLSQSNAAKDIQKQVKSRRDKLQAEFSKYEKELRDNEKKIIAERANMSPEEFASKRQSFEKNIIEKQKIVQGKKLDLEKGVIGATSTVRGEIAKIVASIADEKGYDIVLTRQSVVIVAKEADITADVMARLNKALPKLKLK